MERLSEDVRRRWLFLEHFLRQQPNNHPDMGPQGKEKEFGQNMVTHSGKGEVQHRVAVLE